MKNKKILLMTGIFLALGFLVGFSIYKKQAPKQVRNDGDIHYHAGFVVFKDGEKVDFNDFKYMQVIPCSVEGSQKEAEIPEHTQIEKAHLHDAVGDVVHVHRDGAKWGDLFKNINYPVDYASTSAYINNIKIGQIQDYPINAFDSLVIFLGDVDEKLLNQAVTQERIKEIESKSENCGVNN